MTKQESLLRCPMCGSTDLVYTEQGDYVCARCGTVVLSGVEAETLLAATAPDEFTKHQLQRIRSAQSTKEWLDGQTWTLERAPNSDDVEHERALRLNKEARTIIGANSGDGKKWFTVVAGSKVYLVRITSSDKVAVKALADFTDFPQRIALIIVKGRPGRYKGMRETRYYAERHTIDFSRELQKKLTEKHKSILMNALSKVLVLLFARDESTSAVRKSNRQERVIAHAIAYILVRAGLATKPYKIVNGKTRFTKVADITLDGEPLSGRKSYDPTQMIRRYDKDRAEKIMNTLRSAVEEMKKL